MTRRNVIELGVICLMSASPGAWGDPPAQQARFQFQVQATTGESVLEEADAQEGWFGVHLEVPGPALDRQLELQGTGLLLTNVVHNSPAELAGVQQYDVLLTFEGRAVERDVGALARRIREAGQGAEVDFVVLREARPLELSAILDARMPGQTISWKFESTPENLLRQVYSLHGKVVQTDPKGKVVVTDLGELHNLPAALSTVIPDIRETRVESWSEDGLTKHKIVAMKNDVVIEIEPDADERIYVRKLSIGDPEKGVDEQVFADLDTLRHRDEESFDVLNTVATATFAGQTSNPLSLYLRALPARDASDCRALAAYHKLQSGSAEQQQWMQEMNQALHEHLDDRIQQQIKQEIGPEKGAAWFFEHARDVQAVTPWNEVLEDHVQRIVASQLSDLAVANFRFRELPDGTLEVTVRQQDSELVRSYRDAQVLKQQHPELFDKYARMKSADPD